MRDRLHAVEQKRTIQTQDVLKILSELWYGFAVGDGGWSLASNGGSIALLELR